MSMGIERGMLGRYPYASLGTGDPIVTLAGLMPTTGFGSDGAERGALGALLALEGHRPLYPPTRRPGLPRGVTIAALAAEHADALRASLNTPVDLVGTSTGGSIAQQLAADHPDVVRRLVLVPAPRAASRRTAAGYSGASPPGCGRAPAARRWPSWPRASSRRAAASSRPAPPPGCSARAWSRTRRASTTWRRRSRPRTTSTSRDARRSRPRRSSSPAATTASTRRSSSRRPRA